MRDSWVWKSWRGTRWGQGERRLEHAIVMGGGGSGTLDPSTGSESGRKVEAEPWGERHYRHQ